MIVMINNIYNTEMLTHEEHWTNSDFAFIYFGVAFSGERKTNWTANFADISNCTNCCMMAGSEVSVMTYEQKNRLCGVCVCGGGRAMPMLGLVGQQTVPQFFWG